MGRNRIYLGAGLTLDVYGEDEMRAIRDYVDIVWMREVSEDSTLEEAFDNAAAYARGELQSMGSIGTGGLYNSIESGSVVTPMGVTFYWGANNDNGDGPKLMYLNSGTGKRHTTKGKFTGAVGRATTDYAHRNYGFTTGFADRATVSALGTSSYANVTNKITETLQRKLYRHIDATYTNIPRRI